MKRKKSALPNMGPDLGRRSFLSTIGRVAVLFLLGSFLGKLFIGKRISLSGPESCANNGICARCSSSPNCGLPQALSYRSAASKRIIE